MFKNFIKLILIGCLVIILGAIFLFIGQAKRVESAVFRYSDAPRLANIFFRWDITSKEAKELAQWDILLVDMEVQRYSPESLKKIREYNPDIKILAYLAAQEVYGDSYKLNGTLRKKLYNLVEDEWWLKNSQGQQVRWWPTNPLINVTTDCPTVDGKKFYDVFPWFVKNEIMSSGLWDGVFIDNLWENLDFMSSYKIDLNLDGQADSQARLNDAWKKGLTTLLSNTRNVLGPDAIIIGNGGESYYKYLNGSLYEHFPYKGWSTTLNKYNFMASQANDPSIAVLNVNVNNTMNSKDYKKMRFGLTSSLMGNGFYSFDSGDQSHAEIWWYDEYEVFLGKPQSSAVEVFSGATAFRDGVWRREYENGVVLVNNTNKDYTINLNGQYEKISGQQDKTVNNGATVTSLTLPAQDGIILLKKIGDTIKDVSFVNGSYAKFFDEWGNVSRTGIFVYLPQFNGGDKIMIKDLDQNGSYEYLVADNQKIRIYTDKLQLKKTFYPYSINYNKGINFSVGDLDGNNTLEIITGTENGGGPHVRVFNSQGNLINPGFFAYATNFRGGVDVAVGDLDGNGTAEIICGAGVGGGPHIRVFNKDGKLINPGFFAYDKNFRGGVNVAVADLNGDGRDEIISGPGIGGGPHVKIFNEKGENLYAQFFAFDQRLTSGLEVAGVDINGSGQADIIALTNDIFSVSGF